MAEDEDKELTTEEKAKAIGDKVAEKKQEEDVPDYEVTEEADEGQPVAEQDEKLGRTREDREAKTREKLSNREKRLQRKEKLKQKFDQKDARIAQLERQLNDMGSRFAEIDGKLSKADYNELVGRYNQARSSFEAAEARHDEAFKNGDAEKTRQAMREMYSAQKMIDEIEAIDARNKELAGQRPQPQGTDPTVKQKATEWHRRNPWFKPGAGDDDSAIADAIAAKLKREGYDDRTDTFWDELDERLASKGIGDHDLDEEEDEERPVMRRKEEPVKRRSPPVSGGTRRGDIGNGKVAVTLPTAFIENLKQAGIWDDPSRRNTAIKEYQRIKEEGRG